MIPLIGRGLDGPSFVPKDRAPPRAALGEPVWGATALLRDLELRLALSGAIAPRSVRVPRYAAQIAAIGDANAFYARSFATDPLGTADTLLAWRDALIEGGWNGETVAGGGDRLAALARLESIDPSVEAPLPRGDADRLRDLRVALANHGRRVYPRITLVEDRALWPGAWQRIFAELASKGTAFERFEAELPGAPPGSDLGRLQGLLRGDTTARRDDLPEGLRGDGSILVVRGDAQAEVAALTASLLAARRGETVIVRPGHAGSLEDALPLHGFAPQGITSSSAWRPAMQILPLTVELAFEPRDPHRALELLSLPVGPFRGALGSRLAKAVARSPGIGGREWTKRKLDTHDFLHARELQRGLDGGASDAVARSAADIYAAERMQLVADWLEVPGASPEGASSRLLIEIATRVETWLHSRLAVAPDVYGPALVQAKQLVQALTHDEREVLSREAVRQLLDTVVRAPHDHERSMERAGRLPHVSHPSALLAATGTVVFWSFVTGTERRPPVLPWSRAELEALEAAGILMLDRARFLSAESSAWRHAVAAATERVIFVIPSTIAGAAAAPHPLWDEITARLRLDAATTERLTYHAREVLEGRDPVATVEELAPLELPHGPSIWRLGSDVLGPDREEAGAATSLETLATCPLRWVLESRAELRSGAVAKIASESLLCGNLGHRLIEDLFTDGAFELDRASYAVRAEVILGRLVTTEAATLLLPGMAFERSQLLAQLLRAARALRRYLDVSGFRVIGVEEEIVATSTLGALRGRLDVRLVDAHGHEAVLDLKWADARYRTVITEGRAIQLALYARAIGANPAGTLPPAAYFALRSGRVITTDPRMRAPRTMDGDTLDLTWRRAERTGRAVHSSLKRGDIPVGGTRAALPLLDALEVATGEREAHYTPKADGACKTCSYGALCGRAWEALR